MRESQQQQVDASETFDVAVIGAGVIGCAMARRFTLEGARVVVLEKAADVLDGASKANSAILHTGFDAPSDSLELACIRAGYAEYLEIRQSLNLPLFESGAMVLAWNAEQLAALPELMEQARRNGVMDVQLLDSQQVLGLEPHLSPEVLGGFRVPGESLIDPWSAPHAYLTQALLNGARLELGWALSSARFENHRWLLESPRGAVRARSVINCAGLHGDTVEALLLGHAEFAIRPRKGQFVVYDKSAAQLLRHILLPVPTKITKGIVVCRTVFGNVLVGPTAEEQDERETATLDQPTLETLRQRGGEILPALRDQPVTALYAGLRPASQAKEYQIRAEADWRYIAVGGIRSTGLSSALGTAQHVYRLYREQLGGAHTPLAQPLTPHQPNISEHAPRAWEGADNGGIVCHCERATRAEIEAALSGPLPAHTLAGLKRRTRVTMGRCQGFYCSAALAQLSEGKLERPLGQPLDEGAAHE